MDTDRLGKAQPDINYETQGRTEFLRAALLAQVPELTKVEEPAFFAGYDLLERFDYVYGYVDKLLNRMDPVLNKHDQSYSTPKILVGNFEEHGQSWPLYLQFSAATQTQDHPYFVKSAWKADRLNTASMGLGTVHIDTITVPKSDCLRTDADPATQAETYADLNSLYRAIEAFERVTAPVKEPSEIPKRRERTEPDGLGRTAIELFD